MARAERILLAWSSGKDSAWALHRLRQDAHVQVVGLLTTINADFDRIAMHAVRRELVQRQAAAAGLPLIVAEISQGASLAQYERALRRRLEPARAEGVGGVAFGDLYLEDVRAARERQLAAAGLASLFPLWGLDTARLASDMQAAGLRARVTCVDPRIIDRGCAGEEWDAGFVASLPAGVDPCGENGEFHTFAYAGPMFARPLAISPGPIVEREGYVFADLVPVPEVVDEPV